MRQDSIGRSGASKEKVKPDLVEPEAPVQNVNLSAQRKKRSLSKGPSVVDDSSNKKMEDRTSKEP